MNYWDSVGRWINTLLVFIVGVLAFDALFRLLEANEANIIVSAVRVLSVAFLVPFRGMFGEQEFVLTTLIGVLGYSLLAGIALGVLRRLQASRAQPAPPVHHDPPPATERRASVDSRRPQAPTARAPSPKAGSKPSAPRTKAKGPTPPAAANTPAAPVQGTDRTADRARSPSSTAPEPAPPREDGDGQQRANGRQRRVRPRADAQETPRRHDGARQRTGRRSAPRGSNG
jgi:hypothetical protein